MKHYNSNMQQKSELNISGYKDIFEAIDADDLEGIKAFLPEQMEQRDHWGRTPLHITCAFGKDNAVRVLLESGADIEAKNNYEATPLHWACGSGKDNAVRILLEAGAEIDAKDEDESTPLHLACKSGKDNVVRVLLEAGADIEAKDRNDMTPLFWACNSLNNKAIKALIEALIEAGANVNVKDKYGDTPLHFLRPQNIELAEYLVEHGADPYILNNKGDSFIQKIGVGSPESDMLTELRRQYLEQQMPDEADLLVDRDW